MAQMVFSHGKVMTLPQFLETLRMHPITLDTVVAYQDKSGRYYEPECRPFARLFGVSEDELVPVLLEAAAPVDPGCVCGCWILSQRQKWWYRSLIEKKSAAEKEE